MIRKVYLAQCLNEGDWDAVRKDIDLRPVKGVNGSYSNEEILAELANFGITPEAVTLWGTGNRYVNSYGAKKWQMPVYMYC